MLAFGRRTLRSIPLFFVAALFAGACSHKLESPAVKANQVQPDLVCNAQISAPVVITGDGFTPMPSKVLESKKALILPTVKLSWSSALTSGAPAAGGAGGAAAGGSAGADAGAGTAGAGGSAGTDAGAAGGAGSGGSTGSGTPPASGQTVTASGDPSKTNAKYLRWKSEKEMSLWVGDPSATPTPGMKIDNPGIYDLTITNPDGVQKANIKQALAVVPPPSIKDIIPPALCDDQSDQQLILEGENFLKIGDQLPSVTITSADGKTTITCNPDPNDPKCSIQGVGQCADIPGRNPPAQLCGTATVIIKKGTLTPGDYSVTLTNPAPADCHSTESITLKVNPPPTVTAVNPSKVCSGGSSLDVTGDNFQQGASAELRCCGTGAPDQSTGKCSDGSDPAVTPSTSVDYTDPQHVTANFGPGVTPGDTCNVVIINPDTCEDRPLPHQTVQGTPGPILFYVDPFVAYNGINTQITLYLTSVTGNPTVTLVPEGGCNGGNSIPLTNAKLDPNHANRIQATVAKGTAACVYDVQVKDDTGCAATLPKGLTVTDQLKLTGLNIDPPFGQSGELVPVQITGGGGFVATPRAFLNPTTGSNPVAVQLEGVTMVDATKMTAVVPKNTPVGTYDLVVVNPSGEVGVEPNAYKSLGNAPPTIDTITPQSVVNQTGQQVTIAGNGFDSAATVTVECHDGAGNTTNPAVSGTTCSATGCQVTLDMSGTAQGAVCVITVTNADGSYGKFSALGVTNSSLNLGTPVAGTDMNVGRRALLSAAVRANNASRYVYAIGGDDGQGGAPFQSVEFANVDLFGTMSAWTMNKESLGTARHFLTGTNVGRYIYAIGGNDGSNDLKSAERAIVLSPAEIPHVDDVDLCLSGGATPCFSQTGIGDGLDAGTYAYRVAAVISNTDPVNLGGETLASDPQILKLPTIANHKIAVKLTWSAPVDNAGTLLTGITGYRIYRTPKDGVPGQDEVLLDTVNSASTLSYIDDGTTTLGTDKPLPPGSTSAWQALPDMGTARSAAACVAGQDPADPTKWYVYALEGQGAQSYEFLTVTTQANQRQTVGGSWTAGADNPSVPRHEFGAWAPTSITSPIVTAPDTWVYLGGGRSGGNRTGVVETGKITAGGDLGTWDTTPQNQSSIYAGYAAFVASNKIFFFGGAGLPSGNPNDKGIAAEMQSPLPSLANWNNEGITMQSARYLPGSSIQSAFVFMTGGQATTGGAALTSTEFLAW